MVASCGVQPSTESSSEVRVSAAASLTDAFSEIEILFEETHIGVDVVMNYGGSSTLREQILEGAPVDVFASADQSNMAEVVAAGLASSDPLVFARNSLQIAVPAGNPARVGGLDDFSDDELLIGLCAAAVPCGEYAREVLAMAGVTPAIDTNELDVRALLTKIEAGELDAGITYVTDVASSGGSVDGIAIPGEVNVAADYPIVVLSHASDSDAAVSFVELVRSNEGQEILGEYGFTSP